MWWAYLFLHIPIGKYLFFTSKNAISDKKASETARGLWRHWLESASIKMASLSGSRLSSHKKPKQLGKYCVAGGPGKASCKNNSLCTRISMHLFPKCNEKLRNVWIKFVQKHRPHWQPSAYSALCSAHFESHCFTQRHDIGLEIENNAKTKRWLKKEAYPTVDTVVSSQTIPEMSDREHRQVIYAQYKHSGLYIILHTQRYWVLHIFCICETFNYVLILKIYVDIEI